MVSPGDGALLWLERNQHGAGHAASEDFLGPLTPNESLGGEDIFTSAHIRVFSIIFLFFPASSVSQA